MLIRCSLCQCDYEPDQNEQMLRQIFQDAGERYDLADFDCGCQNIVTLPAIPIIDVSPTKEHNS